MARVGYLVHTLPDEYYTQIGAILAKWASLEYQMMYIIWRAMGLENEEGRVLTVGMGTQVLCGILRNLPRKWITQPDVQTAVADLVKFVSEHADSRNYLAHGMWTKFPDDPAPYLNFMKTGEHRILPAAQAVTPEQLRGFSAALDAMNHLASQIISVVGGNAAPPLPDKSEEQNPAGLPTQTQTGK